jgi:molybdate transport system permease protein
VAVAGLFARLGLPVLTLVGRALLDGSFGVAIATPVVLDALVLSLVTTAISLVIRSSSVCRLPSSGSAAFRGKSMLETIVDLPIVLPPSVAGLALLLAFDRRGFFRSVRVPGDSVPFTTIAVVLAMTFVSAPFFIRYAERMPADGDLEDAARVDGASEQQLFRSIAVPLASTARRGLDDRARSLGEFGATIMFAGNIRQDALPLVVCLAVPGR